MAKKQTHKVKTARGKSTGRKVYSDDEKKEVLEAIETAGRGGAAAVSKKFGVSLPTIYVWKRQAGGGRKNKKSSGVRTALLERMIEVAKELDIEETKLAELEAEFGKLKKGL